MTDETNPWGVPEAGSGYGDATPVPPTTAAPAGWYHDPWSSDHHRYWDGAAWTAGTFPNGPSNPWARPEPLTPEAAAARLAAQQWSASPPPPIAATAATTTALPPPSWTPPESPAAPTTPLAFGSGDTAPVDLASEPSRLPTGLSFVALVIAVMLVVGALGTLGGYLVFRHRSPTTSASGLPPQIGPGTTTPSTVPRAVSSDPDASSLSSIVLTQADVPATVVVAPISGGEDVTGQTTLDLCNGTFPSESLRTARLQVAAYDSVSTEELLSTEAVLYGTASDTVQAFAELKSVAANCPSTPVVSPVGEPTATTTFNAAPDAGWPQAATVTRQAYDFTSTDEQGNTSHNVAVYLRRGRVLMGVYFAQPDSPQISVAGQSTIEGIVGVFAGRMASLPSSVVNG